MNYYDTTNPCRVCGAASGERCVNTGDGPGHTKGADRGFPHASMGDRQWDASWSAGYSAARGVDVIATSANRQRGHIALGESSGPALLTFCDIGGGELRFWASTSARLGPDAARNLAAELTMWADRREV